MKPKFVILTLILAIIIALLVWRACGPDEPIVTKTPNATVTIEGQCDASVDLVDAYTNGTVTFTNRTECTITIVFGTVGDMQPFEVATLTLAPNESQTLEVVDGSDGTYMTSIDCGSCDPSGGSSTPVIKVSPPPPVPPDGG